jgi:hypothetical protein
MKHWKMKSSSRLGDVRFCRSRVNSRRKKLTLHVLRLFSVTIVICAVKLPCERATALGRPG